MFAIVNRSSIVLSALFIFFAVGQVNAQTIHVSEDPSTPGQLVITITNSDGDPMLVDVLVRGPAGEEKGDGTVGSGEPFVIDMPAGTQSGDELEILISIDGVEQDIIDHSVS